MDASTLFLIANLFVLIGWTLLLLAPKWKYTKFLVRYGIIIVLSGLYSFLILNEIFNSNLRNDSFSTLGNVRQLFQSDNALLAGWVHYLAFDLFVGLFIVENARTLNVPRWLVTLILPVTFLFGPLGYILFQIIKSITSIRK